ncbi:unnamed protein product [Didymodactylos carnosus]|uniref:VWFA domain-containing protein n=1 Tax=Didymodactylos carnosus TaxID=1234261 RepID=A0A815H1Q5_9BILA|nr:unnamed protein product [Didymodactylos carnosus]CAF1348112.1 unnamed protein product [Didymodactylos carnosus]CAF3681062.1 unnamed protein product [Didymodactylos carnosus]CAF4215715.1 unnamed protein product [Didymodactylos carnosus]
MHFLVKLLPVSCVFVLIKNILYYMSKTVNYYIVKLELDTFNNPSSMAQQCYFDIVVCLVITKRSLNDVRLQIESMLNNLSVTHLRLALILADQVEQNEFVIRAYNFTPLLAPFQNYLRQYEALTEVKSPEEIAKTLHRVLDLGWRVNNTDQNHFEMWNENLCILMTDAPPLKSDCDRDCPSLRHVAQRFDEKGITLIVVGVDREAMLYESFYCDLAKITGGTFIPFEYAEALSKIVNGSCGELTVRQTLFQMYPDGFRGW